MFQKGQPRPPGSGRRKGQVSDRTVLARQGLKTAIEICRQGGDDPITIMMNGARFLNTIAAAFAPRRTEGVELRDVIRATPVKDLELTRKFIESATSIAHKAAEFGYAKLQRIDYVGDAPVIQQTTENRVIVMLKIGDDDKRPGSSAPTIDMDEDEFGEEGDLDENDADAEGEGEDNGPAEEGAEAEPEPQGRVIVELKSAEEGAVAGQSAPLAGDRLAEGAEPAQRPRANRSGPNGRGIATGFEDYDPDDE